MAPLPTRRFRSSASASGEFGNTVEHDAWSDGVVAHAQDDCIAIAFAASGTPFAQQGSVVERTPARLADNLHLPFLRAQRFIAAVVVQH